MLDMPRPRPPYIHRLTSRHGKITWYFHRVGGRRIRLPDAYGTPEFWAAYNAALAGTNATAKPAKAERGTLQWLVTQYKGSGEWARLAPSTKRVRDRLMQGVCEKAGEMPIRQITRAVVEKGRDKRAEKPEAANAFVKLMRVLLRHAVRLDLIETNPADQVDLFSGSPDGFHTWTVDEVERFEAKHPVGTKARLAMDIMLYTGLRRSDVVLLGRQHIRDGVLTIRPHKTQRNSAVVVTRRVLPPLAASIEATPVGDLHLLVTEFGKPFTSNGFGNWFRKRCNEAGVPGSCHGLRKAGAVRAAEAGATTQELMAMFGWVTAKEADRYTREADRKKMGLSGSDKLSEGLSPDRKVRETGRKGA